MASIKRRKIFLVPSVGYITVLLSTPGFCYLACNLAICAPFHEKNFDCRLATSVVAPCSLSTVRCHLETIQDLPSPASVFWLEDFRRLGLREFA